ncbi:MAG: homoserine dehydrogenase [Anaerolineae bacterium]|nr:homoserine dehydrogenase [Anaerolineae bacterium]
MKLALIGFGTVGQGFVEILRDKSAELEARYGFAPQLVAVATRSRGTLLLPDGLDPARLLTAIEAGHFRHYPDAPGLVRDLDVPALIRASGADVLLEAGPTDLQTAQPALAYCYAALDQGMHLVLANKGPVAVAYADLQARARQAGKRVLFEGTVMAGTPSLRLAQQALAGCTIQAARGILNGTTNYILTQMEGGMSYAEALRQAQALGYAEADPTADVDGWDAASKALILAAALFDRAFTLADLDVQGIANITTADIAAAQAAGERWKLIAHVTPAGGSVSPQRVSNTHPLAAVGGATNAVTFTTDLLGDVTLVGPGAGRRQTGFALLADVLDLL